MSWPVRDTVFHSLNEHEPFASTQCWKEWTTVGMDCCILVTVYSESNSVIFFKLASLASNSSARKLRYRKPVKLCSKDPCSLLCLCGQLWTTSISIPKKVGSVERGCSSALSGDSIYKKRLKVCFFFILVLKTQVCFI